MTEEEEWNPRKISRSDLEETARTLIRRKYVELQQAAGGYNGAQTMKQREHYMHLLAEITHDIGVMSETIARLDILSLKEMEYMEESYHV